MCVLVRHVCLCTAGLPVSPLSHHMEIPSPCSTHLRSGYKSRLAALLLAVTRAMTEGLAEAMIQAMDPNEGKTAVGAVAETSGAVTPGVAVAEVMKVVTKVTTEGTAGALVEATKALAVVVAVLVRDGLGGMA